MSISENDHSHNQPGAPLGRASTNSEVVSMDGANLAASTATPNICNLSVTKSSRVHIGPKFVSVTQNLQNSEVVKGLTESWYLRRGNWHAMPSCEIEFLELPLSYVIIGHSAYGYCNQLFSCIDQMRVIQQEYLRRGMGDIGPNFLVGGNGYVFDGRGANIFGAMVSSWNVRSITIICMGNYVLDMPDQGQFDHINILLDVLVKEHVLRSDYILYGQCQVKPDTYVPGRHLTERMKNFLHWNPRNISGCLRLRK